MKPDSLRRFLSLKELYADAIWGRDKEIPATDTLLRSRLEAVVKEMRGNRRRHLDLEEIAAMSPVAMAEELVDAGWWGTFAGKYDIALVNGKFYGGIGLKYEKPDHDCWAYREENDGCHCSDCPIYKHKPACRCTDYYKVCPEYNGGITSIVGRWADPIVGITYRADGTRVDDGRPKEVLDRLEAISDAWRIWHETDDDSRLIELGMLSGRQLELFPPRQMS